MAAVLREQAPQLLLHLLPENSCAFAQIFTAALLQVCSYAALTTQFCLCTPMAGRASELKQAAYHLTKSLPDNTCCKITAHTAYAEFRGQTAATGVVLVEAELTGFAQRSLAKFQGLESRFTGAKGGRAGRSSGGLTMLIHTVTGWCLDAHALQQQHPKPCGAGVTCPPIRQILCQG